MSERAIEILRHALGLDQSDQSYRNYYAASEETSGLLESLVGRGWMVRGQDRGGGLFFYHCTSIGIAIAMEQTAKPTRRAIRKARYLRFLNAKDAYPDLTFKEFLTKPFWEESRKMP
jgi:hypothetical protein